MPAVALNIKALLKPARNHKPFCPLIRPFNSNSSPGSILPQLALPHKDKPHKLHNNNHLNISPRLLSLKNRLKELLQKSKEPKNRDAKEIKAAFDYEFRCRPKKLHPPTIKEKETNRRLKDIKNRLMEHDKHESR